MKRGFTQPLPPINPPNLAERYPESTIHEMMNFIEHPALFVEAAGGGIHYANRAMVEATTFSLEDFTSKHIQDFVEAENLENIYKGIDFKARVMRRNRSALTLYAQALLVDQARQFYILVFRPIVDVVRDVQTMNPATYEAFVCLGRAVNTLDIEEALKLVIDSIKVLFTTDIVCIYRAESDFPRIVKVSQSSGAMIFPGTLPSTDLYKLGVTNIWTPGKRVNAEIHRIARMAELEYVATAPLGDHNAGTGLLVIGDAWNPPSQNLRVLMELLSSLVDSILRRHILYEGLNERLGHDQNQLIIQREAIAVSKDGIILVAPDLTIEEINPAAEWLLGYTLNEVRGKTADNILIGPERVFSALEAACQGEPTHNLGDCSLHRRDGQAFPALVRMIPVENAGTVIGVLVFINDLSEQVQSQRNSQQLEHRAVLGDFTAIFAHDLRNPVNNISTGMQLILSRINEDDPNYDIVSRALNDCGRIDHLMESVLAFSRSMEPKLEAVNVNIFMRRLLDRWRPAMAKVNVQSVIQVPEVAPIANGDPRLLDRLFTNLINNAIDAMKATDGGTIAVKVDIVQQKNHDQVKISISDTGPGIPDEVRHRIFEPFVTTKPSGTGLGLSICKRIVTVHKGSITVDSFPGGTVFHVVLPVYEGV